MKKNMVYLLAILSLVVLYGCTSGNEDAAPQTDPFIGGNEGIVAEFLPMGIEEDGIETVFEEEDFDVVVNLKNKGESDIATNKATVKILGIDTALFGITDPIKDTVAELEKVSEFNSIGGEEDIDFGKAGIQSIVGSFLDATFFAHIDYDYSTFVNVPAVCFKHDLQDETICDISGSKRVFTSGGPMQVRSVEEDIAGNKRIALTFEIDNVGGGRATIQDEEFLSRFDRVGFTLSEQNWECKSAGSSTEARFTDNRATLRCTSPPLAEEDLFTKQVTLQLDYLYRDTIQQTVRIKQNPKL